MKSFYLIFLILLLSIPVCAQNSRQSKRGKYLRMLPKIISNAWHSTIFDIYYISEKKVFERIRKKDDTAAASVSSSLNINLRNKDNFSMLELASQNGLKNTVSALLQCNAMVNTICPDELKPLDSKYGRAEFSPLMFAAHSGQTEICRILLENKADINYETSYGFTALYCAALNGYSDTVHLLAESGTDLKKRHTDKYTSYTRLVTAICLKNRVNPKLAAQMLQCLIIMAESGAETDYSDPYGSHPSIIALYNTSDQTIYTTVIRYSKKLFAPDTKGNIPFLCAVRTEKPEMVKPFFKYPIPDEILKKALQLSSNQEILFLLKKY